MYEYVRMRLRINFLSALSAHCGCLSPWTWFLMHVPPRFHSSGENVHTACARNVALTLQAFFCFPHCSRIACTADVALILQVFALFCFLDSSALLGSHTTCLSAWNTTRSNISLSVLACLFLRTFKSGLQPLVQTRFTVESSEP